MPCACQNKRQSFEVIQARGTGRIAFTSSSQGTAESVADRYNASIVRDKKTGDVLYHSWPKGSYEVALQTGEVVFTGTERSRLKASADAHTNAGAVVRSTTNGTVVYPLAAALAANNPA